QRHERARRILVKAQARGAGEYRDHVDRMTGRIVEIARDAGTLLSRREEPLTVRLLCQTIDALVSQPYPLAREPGHRPQRRRVHELESRKRRLLQSSSSNVRE